MDTQNPPTNHALFGPLTNAIREQKCIVIIGAGVSAEDYPLWSDLVGGLKDSCKVRPEHIRSNDLLGIAEAAKKNDPSTFFSVLDETFARKENPKSLYRYHMLARIPFASYITLNYDPLLLDTFDLHRNINVSQYPSLNNQHHNNRELFYIHGRLGPDRPAENTQIVLTRTEFEEAYDPHKNCLHGFLQSTFLHHDVCFIGCNPDEPHMRFLLEACKNYCEEIHGWRDARRPKWFLLWDDKSDASQLLNDCGIHVVKYPRTDKEFSGLDQVLEHWAEKKKPVFRKAGVERPSYDADRKPEIGSLKNE